MTFQKILRHTAYWWFNIIKPFDSVLWDSKLSALLSLLNILTVIILLLCKLTLWGIIENLFIVHQNLFQDPFKYLDTVGTLFTIIFWTTSRSFKMEMIVLLGWLILLFLVFIFDYLFYNNLVVANIEQTLLGTLALPCIVALLLRIFGKISIGSSPLYEMRLKWLFLSIILSLIPAYPALMLCKEIHTRTFDLFSLHFDVLLFSNLIPELKSFIDSIPNAPTVLTYAYGFTPIGFLAVSILQLRGRPKHIPSALLVWVAAAPLAIIAYNFFPITGPYYAFGDIHAAFLNASSYALDMTTPADGARNGMPSMHFGWMFAATILWCQSGTKIYSRAIMIIQTVLVFIATLYLGEHYLMDLVVAAPFMLSILALCTTNISFHFTPRKHAIIIGFLIWFFWVMTLRTELSFYLANPWLAKCLVVLTLMLTGWQYTLLSKFKISALASSGEKERQFA